MLWLLERCYQRSLAGAGGGGASGRTWSALDQEMCTSSPSALDRCSAAGGTCTRSVHI